MFKNQSINLVVVVELDRGMNWLNFILYALCSFIKTWVTNIDLVGPLVYLHLIVWNISWALGNINLNHRNATCVSCFCFKIYSSSGSYFIFLVTQLIILEFGISVRKYIDSSWFQLSGVLPEKSRRASVKWFSTFSYFNPILLEMPPTERHRTELKIRLQTALSIQIGWMLIRSDRPVDQCFADKTGFLNITEI